MIVMKINERFKLLLSIGLLLCLITACESTKPSPPQAPTPPPISSRFPPDVMNAALASTTKPVKPTSTNPSSNNTTATTTAASITGSSVSSSGQIVLSAGIDFYNNGQYQQAIKKLQTIVDSSVEDYLTQISAYKYISFSMCVLGRKAGCKENFEKLLRLNPSFELTQAEAGHPTWGPVFKQAKTAVLK